MIYSENEGSHDKQASQQHTVKTSRSFQNVLRTSNDESNNFEVDFGAILDPFWHPKSVQNHIKTLIENRWPKK